MAAAIVSNNGPLPERLQKGLGDGFAFYEAHLADGEELAHYDRLRDLERFAGLGVDSIRSTGYVVDAIEAAVWSLATTDSFEKVLLKAVNLGDDTDTVGAIAGGLAGLYYQTIPEAWSDALQRREWIENLIEETEHALHSI
jgi:ADP-ribosylglycohydrolase